MAGDNFIEPTDHVKGAKAELPPAKSRPEQVYELLEVSDRAWSKRGIPHFFLFFEGGKKGSALESLKSGVDADVGASSIQCPNGRGGGELISDLGRRDVSDQSHVRRTIMELDAESRLLQRQPRLIQPMVREAMLHQAGYGSSAIVVSELEIGKVVEETSSFPKGIIGLPVLSPSKLGEFEGTCYWGADSSTVGNGHVVVTLSEELREALPSSCSSRVNYLVSTSMGGVGRTTFLGLIVNEGRMDKVLTSYTSSKERFVSDPSHGRLWLLVKEVSEASPMAQPSAACKIRLEGSDS
ncbi:hypothetical protein ACLOJK_027796 [Asimina triloba]